MTVRFSDLGTGEHFRFVGTSLYAEAAVVLVKLPHGFYRRADEPYGKRHKQLWQSAAVERAE